MKDGAHTSQQNMFPSFFQSPRPPSDPNLAQRRKDPNCWFPRWKTILQPKRQRQPPIKIKPVETGEPSKEEIEAREHRKQEMMEKHKRWLEKRKKRNENLNAESRVVQLREKKERHKEKKREARRRKRNETIRETAEDPIARREPRMSTEVNRHTQAKKIWVKMRHMRRACLRVMDNVRHYMDEVHKKTAAFINRNFDVFIIPLFETQSMMKKERSDGKKRKLNVASVRSMCSWSHYRFRTYLRAVMGGRAVVYVQHYTSKTRGKCGRINHQLN